MAPTRERDRHGTPILISSPRSSTRKSDIAPPGEIAKLPPRPPRVQEQGAEASVDNLRSGKGPVNVSGGHSLVSNRVNVNGKLLPAIPGLTYGLQSASVPQPIPNIAKMEPNEHGPRAAHPKYDVAPPAVHKLPFNVEHSILCTMQKLAEEGMFYWAKEWAPRLLEMEGWESPEAGELNQWLGAMMKWSISPNAFSRSAGMSLYKIRTVLKDLHHVRHAAVHRNPTGISRLKQMLGDARLLTIGLRDNHRNNKLRAMAMALETSDVKAMEAIIVAPLSTFKDAPNFQRFQTQTANPGAGLQQKENIDPGRAGQSTTNGSAHDRGVIVRTGPRDSKTEAKDLKRSGPVKLEEANLQAAKSKYPTGVIDLTMDSDDELPATGLLPTKSTGVIDLTGDEHVVLFRSPRAFEIQDD